MLALVDGGFVAELDARLEPLRRRFLAGRLVRRVMSGQADARLYAQLLQETYHFVRRTPLHLLIAAERMSSGPLRERYERHAAAESGHDAWALQDLAALGVNPVAAQASDPLPHTAALIAYQRYAAACQDPISLLGLEYAMEGMTARAAGSAVEVLQRAGIPAAATRFFQRHAALDARHAADDAGLIARFARAPDQQAAVLRNARDSLVLYGAMYEGICDELGLD